MLYFLFSISTSLMNHELCMPCQMAFLCLSVLRKQKWNYTGPWVSSETLSVDNTQSGASADGKTWHLVMSQNWIMMIAFELHVFNVIANVFAFYFWCKYLSGQTGQTITQCLQEVSARPAVSWPYLIQWRFWSWLYILLNSLVLFFEEDSMSQFCFMLSLFAVKSCLMKLYHIHNVQEMPLTAHRWQLALSWSTFMRMTGKGCFQNQQGQYLVSFYVSGVLGW